MIRQLGLFSATALLGVCTCLAQAPTGTVAGTVTDESGAVVPGALLKLSQAETALDREGRSGPEGEFSFPALAAGVYEVRAEAAGFRTVVRKVTVETGSTTLADVRLPVGSTKDVVTVESAGAQISYEGHKIDSVITREQIENMPMNGRSFLQLAALEPGVTVITQSTAQYNAQFGVFVLGGSNARTAVGADGGNVRDRTTGNTSLNFSQEVVQEFQLSAVNFDLSTGITSVGAVNIVTRSGGNEHHGSGYFFFRDHNMSAYPALKRNAFNPEPFFARRQSGFWLGGPLKKDKIFYFFNLEHSNQDAVVTVQPNTASLSSFAQIAPAPYTGKQISQRFDWRIHPNHSLFARYSHDGNRASGPSSGSPLPSNWLVNDNWSDQSILGVTSVFRPTLVNDFRFQYAYWRNRNLFPSASDCRGCLGFDYPQVSVAGTNFVIGHTQNATQGRDYRTFQLSDSVNWQRGLHRIRFGGEWEMDITQGFWGFCDPACITVYSLETARRLAPAMTLPSQIRNEADLLELPMAAITVGYGDPRSPAPFQRDNSTRNHRLRLFLQDSWRVKPRFTINYGLAWQAETTLANHDLDKPAFLTAILGGGENLKATRRDWNNVTPSLGFAWNVSRDNKTVIRAGAGVYYDTQLLWERLNERNLLGPRGNGRTNVSGGAIPNPVTGVNGVPVGRPLDFPTVPTEFRLKDMMSALKLIGPYLQANYTPNFSDLSVRGIDVAKAVTGFATIIPHDYPELYAFHFNVGVQRELAHRAVLTADFVSRQFIHENFGTTLDVNRWQSARGPVIPACANAQQRDDPKVVCSTGVFQGRIPGARTNYKGMLVKLEKRYSRGYQFTASYALQYRNGVNGNVNKDNWFYSWGPQGAHHVLNLSGLLDLKWGFQVSAVSVIRGRLPVMPSLVGIDIDGDGTGSEPLPGVPYNGFNRGLGKAEIDAAVAAFNQRYAGTVTSRGQRVSTVTLPGNYEFGDAFYSQDFRVSKHFKFRERWKLSVFGEVFNAFNVANLDGYGFNLYDPSGFGQPTVRTDQIFGSGGPRAFQIGARVSF